MKWEGKTGLIWFTGIVEDRDDPLFLNRVRVRIYGVHTYEKQLIATPDLPWSQVLMPVTSPSLSGLGTTTHGLVEGSTVMGFWRDGLGMQDPVIMGSFIGQPEKTLRKSISTAGGEEEIIRFHLREKKDEIKKGPVKKLEDQVKRGIGGTISDGDYTITSGMNMTGDGTGLVFSINIKNKKKGLLESSGYINSITILEIENAGNNYAVDDQITFFIDTTSTGEKRDVTDYLEGPDGANSGILRVTAIEEIKEIPEGFQDPRLEKIEMYDETSDGPTPQHLSSRSYGLTLDLDNSPKPQPFKDAVNYPKEDYIGTSDVNKLARQDGKYDETIWPNSYIEDKTTFGSKLGFDVPLTLYDGGILKGNNEDRSKWVKPKYPFNHVYESESGHVIEIDDTPGYERINLFHRSGARIEINPAGEIHMIAGPNQDINLQGANVNIRNKGSGTLNVESDCEVNILAKQATTIISQGPTSIISSGVTKLFSLLDTKIKSIGKNIIG